ncbi:hypothetical protein L288_06540 [Sphingobium quisquiliarum P25]|uniref:DUF2490 domain-containing protein n=1 Tax=Sphingobium quisquiliarum P25 TaxID=1329909 RepID=T0GYW5_9SPHN|nr:DUF2490 domain-containing protein [Sphingobium quisquiliarum]EQB09171.1 hypothetical protein L288_06540 [Sphingobium quisquiliarum P25]
MPRPLRPRHISGALPLLAAIAAPPATAATEETQAWITESLTIAATPADSISLDLSQRFRRDSSNGEQQTARILLDHRIANGLQIGGGFAFFHSGPEQELRLFQQATVTRGIFLARTRIEQRFFDTADGASWRLRQRVQASLPLGSPKAPVLIAAAELFFHLNRARPGDKTGVAAMRQQIGLRQPLGRSLDAQLLYMRQQSVRDSAPDAVVHVPWLTLNWKI